MIRNFLLVSGLAFMKRGSTGQLLLGMLVSDFTFVSCCLDYAGSGYYLDCACTCEGEVMHLYV